MAVGTPQTLTMQATVVSPSPQTNTATIGSVDQFDPDPANNAAAATETPQQADLSLTKTVSDPDSERGRHHHVHGHLDQQRAERRHQRAGAGPPAGRADVRLRHPEPGHVRRRDGPLDRGQRDRRRAADPDRHGDRGEPGPQTNTATISSADQFDPDPANNTASATETPQQADLSLIKTVSDATPNVGDTITFTVTLTNIGPDAATSVQVQDLLPAGLTFVSANPSQGSYDTVTGLWDVGTVTTGTPQTLSIMATVVSPSPLTNTATITDADQFDPNTANNSASATETPL